MAVVNDTVGTMMTCAYEEPTCEVGLIVGGCCRRSLRGARKAGFSCFVGLGTSSSALCVRLYLSCPLTTQSFILKAAEPWRTPSPAPATLIVTRLSRAELSRDEVSRGSHVWVDRWEHRSWSGEAPGRCCQPVTGKEEVGSSGLTVGKSWRVVGGASSHYL